MFMYQYTAFALYTVPVLQYWTVSEVEDLTTGRLRPHAEPKGQGPLTMIDDFWFHNLYRTHSMRTCCAHVNNNWYFALDTWIPIQLGLPHCIHLNEIKVRRRETTFQFLTILEPIPRYISNTLSIRQHFRAEAHNWIQAILLPLIQQTTIYTNKTDNNTNVSHLK